MTRVLAALTLLAASFAPAALEAQQGWEMELAAGRAVHDPLAASVGTDNLMLGVRYAAVRPGWFYLSGGAPISSEGSPWGAAGLGSRLSTRTLPLPVALDLGLHLFGFTYSVADTLAAGDAVPADSLAGGATLEILPLLVSRLGPAEVELQSGLVQYTLLHSGETTTRRVHQSAARAFLAPHPVVALGVDTRLLRTPEGSFPYVGGTVQLMRGPAFAWGGAGRWLSDEIPTPVYGVGIGVRPGARLELRATWQQEASDPLYWNPPRRSWGVRASHVLGRPIVAASPVAVPATDGRTIIRIPAETSPTAPYVLGEFTDWEPVPMVLVDGHWTVVLAIPPGVYRYGFRTAEGRWFVPSTLVGSLDDGMGGTSAVLIVP